MSGIFELEDVTFIHHPNLPPVMDGFNLSIKEGSHTAILGANGAGKTTLFYTLTGVYKPQKGEVLYKGEPLEYTQKGLQRIRSEAAVVLQNPDEQIFCSLVEEDIAFGPLNLDLPQDVVEERVDAALKAVRMTPFRRRPLQQLSGGQRKRIAIAGALAMQPKVMIMDEPTAGLDPQMAYEVMEIAEQLHSSGVTVIMSSHDTDLTYAWADEIHVLNGGKCIYSGPSEPFYDDRRMSQKAGLFPPSVFQMNKTLTETGKCELLPYPKTQTQMAVKMAGCMDRDFDTLHMIRATEGIDPKAIIEEKGFQEMPKRLYGLSARASHDEYGFDVDFLYNGPENCVMKCLSGTDSVLICDPLMFDKAEASADFINNNGFGKIGIDLI